MKRFLNIAALVCFALFSAETVLAKPADDEAIIRQVRQIVEDITANSYPELKNARIEIKLFDSSADYFQTRFTFTSFLFRPGLRYLLKVNRNLFVHLVPVDGVRAIIAHELGHIFYFRSRNRIKLIGLVRLVCKDFTAQFERGTDMQAINRGYAEGLKSYRQWLYGQIRAGKLAEKKRNYFSPEEIDALQQLLRLKPELKEKWLKHPPLSLDEVKSAVKPGGGVSTAFGSCEKSFRN